MAIALPRDLSCHARLGSQVLGGSREALRRGGATAGYASQPRRCEGAGAQCAGRLGPKNGAKWTDWVRFGWGNTFWRCRFSWGYLLIEWKYMGDAKEKMAHSYPPVVGSFFALKTMSWWVVPYHIPSHQYERPDGHYCLPLSKKKKHLIPATQQKGGTVPSYVLYIPLYYSWYPTISYPHYWLPNYILIISPDPIGGFHAPWATSATSNKMPNSWTKLMAETSSIYI